MTGSISRFVTVRVLAVAVAAALLVLNMSAGSAAAKSAPGGTMIRNIAEATYFHTGLGIMETIRSNPVDARVSEVSALDVVGHSDLNLMRGAGGQYYFTVLNTGNTPLGITPGIRTQGLASLIGEARLLIDLNRDGVIGADERIVDGNLPRTLEAGEQVSYIYEFQVAQTAQAGDLFSAHLEIDAQNPSQTIELSGSARGDTTIVSVALDLAKRQFVQPGDDATVLTYGLELRNNSTQDMTGYSEIDGMPLRIDGAVATGILVRDVIPLNTVFEAITQEGDTAALFHRRGDPLHDYLTELPADRALIDAVGFFLAGDYPVSRSSDAAFSVAIDHALGAVVVTNTARTYIGAAQGAAEIMSNSVTYTGAGDGSGRLDFIDPVSGAAIEAGRAGADTRLSLSAGACNVSGLVDTLEVVVRSTLTGDIESLVATETGPNSGVFVTPAVPLAQMVSGVRDDGVIATDLGDILEASAVCGDIALGDTLPIGVGNTVFNAMTNAAIADVVIAVLDASTGIEVTRSTSDARGFVEFANIPEGEYRLVKAEAAAWHFPSVRPAFAGYGRNTSAAAYGAAFYHSGGPVSETDIPLDPVYAVPLSLSKTAARDRVSLGEFLRYSLSIGNNMHQALVEAEILDRAPVGAELVAGSVRFDDAVVADPQRDNTGGLVFALGTLAPLKTYELTYVMRFTAAAREGRTENTAVLSGRQAGTNTQRQSAIARAVVRLDNSGGVFSRQGTVVGSVFMDCDGNGLRGDQDEPGIPGVRIVTQDGLFVVTDIDGKYSLSGLRPLTHAFQVQSSTLPVDAEIAVTRTNDLGRGGSRLVPLRRGELRTENFAAGACSAQALAEVSARRAKFAATAKPGAQRAADLPITGRRAAKRSVRSEAGVSTTTQLASGFLAEQETDATVSAEGGQASSAGSRQPLDALVSGLDTTAAFMDLHAGAILSSRTLNLRIKGKSDLQLGLLVNGREIGKERIGARATWAAGGVQAVEFVAVKLRSGVNYLTLIGKDGFGIERVRKEIKVTAPGDPARLDIVVPETASADPVAIIPVVVRILDATGLPVPASGIVTLQARKALWDVEDIRPGLPGVQAYVDNGEATFGLIPPQISGPDTITVHSAFAKAQTRVTFVPNLDDRVLIGVIEGAVSLGGGNNNALLPADQFSSFEDTTTGLNGKIYLKGAIKGDALLTLRYSSDRDTEDRLFRDVRGDEYYPVYGDTSERGFDAQSASNLFVKVEKGRSYVLYGDIAIEPDTTALKLGTLRRSATGARGHWENDKVSVSVFAAKTNQQQQVVEFAGRGVSGPYDLGLAGYIEGSERVELLVRDEEGGDVVSSTPLRAGSDYMLDYFRNTITFDEPVRQSDFSGNPVSVRITYEVEESGADEYWLYGGEVNIALGARTTVGAGIVHADAEFGNDARQRLQSAYVRHENKLGGQWEAELARSENAVNQSDLAGRISYEIRKEDERFRFEAIHTGERFMTGSGLARAGTTQLRMTYGVAFDRKHSLEVSAEYVKDRMSETETARLSALFGQKVTDGFRATYGLELERSAAGGSLDNRAVALLGADWTPANQSGVAVRAELRMPVAGPNSDNTELLLGVYHDVQPGWRTYNEVELTFGSRAFVTRARSGMEYKINDWLLGTTEFSQGLGEIEQTRHQGINATWKMNRLTTFQLGLEHSAKAISGNDKLTSVTLGAKWEDAADTLVGDVDFDTTFEEDGNTYYASLGLGAQISENWAFLGRSRIALNQTAGANDRRMRTRIGAAYRPREDSRLDILAWYEHQREQTSETSEAHLWSVDASYEASNDLRLNAKYAGQHQSASVEGSATYAATTHLVQGGLYLDFGSDRFQLGLNAARLWDSEGNATSGAGLELGFAPAQGTLISLGYNATKGEVSSQSTLYQKGLYLRMNLLLDESLWSYLDGLFVQ